ncbi:MAG: hypothetical protein HY303_19795 [Candidatus Wallbacteria bacterium]|nr:hypothetical protein [Candidatus Wallbacteria bacterium]
MALPDLHPSPAEVFWMWVKRTFASLVLILLEFALFTYVLARPPAWAGFALCPFVALATWQFVSRIMTREYFSLSFNPMVSKPRELADVLLSVGFTINLLWFLYHLYIWFPTPPR